MALNRRSKMAFQQPGVQTRIRYEAYTDVSADDVIAFMAQSEATRRYTMARNGIHRETQVPSDELKMHLVASLEE